jgi:MFS family permease
MNATSNAALFIFIGVIVVTVQGGFVGRWSRRYGDRWLIGMGLLVLGIGTIFFSLTPSQAVPWYSRAELTAELSAGANRPGETPPTQDIQIELPGDGNNGWLGLVWVLLAMVPVGIGGGVLQPSINSQITKQVGPTEVGGILGISAAFLSGANAISPLILGAIFQWLGASAPFLIGGVILIGLWVVVTRKI